MSTLGIIGGVGPRATSVLDEGLIRAHKRRAGGVAPEVVIYSLPIDLEIESSMIRGLAEPHCIARVRQQLDKALRVLGRLDVDAIALPCNTLTYYLRGGAHLPIHNPVDAVIRRLRAGGERRVGLFATGSTLRLGLYQSVAEREGVAIVTPNRDEQEFVAQQILAQIDEGIGACGPAVLDVVKRLAETTDAVILGCTDLHELAAPIRRLGIPVVDSLEELLSSCLAHLAPAVDDSRDERRAVERSAP